jgi:pimeloyl-ACP methyl ester carboxylesterase
MRLKSPFKQILITVLVLIVIVLAGPFLVPVPPLENTVPPSELADPDSQFVQVEGLDVHYKKQGSTDPALILLHGFGASVFSWREVMPALSASHTLVAFDRPAFGLTERPTRGEWQDQNPYTADAQVAITVGLMDVLDIERGILVGHSAGGRIATLTALAHPDRVRSLVLISPAIYAGGGTPGIFKPLLNTSQMRHLGPLISRQIEDRGIDFIRSAWHDPTEITDGILAGYQKPLRAQNWDRALWELTTASQTSELALRLDEIEMPVLVITGDDDRIVPTEDSIRLANELPNATLLVVPQCGHVAHEECPHPVIEAVRAFIERTSER